MPHTMQRRTHANREAAGLPAPKRKTAGRQARLKQTERKAFAMFYGVSISSGVRDWQVFQRVEGKAKIHAKGLWRLEEGAVRAGVRSATPVYRLVSEQDQSQVLPWTPCQWQTGGDRLTGEEAKGEWETDMILPQGGPYRLETSLDAVSKATGEHWMFRGDIRVHIGVGDVFCMAGQSNAAGYAKGLAFDPPDVRVHLQRNSGKWDMAAHPMNDATDAADCLNAPMSVTGTSPFLSFGRRYADYTGLPVGLVQAAQGGSPMARWDMRRNGDLYRNMLVKIRAAGGVRAILWYQGCADADAENAALYAESFARLVEDTRRELDWEIPFFTLQLNRYESQPDSVSWGKIKEIQRQAALKTARVYLLPTAGLPQGDEIHTSAAGNVMLGEMLARQAYGALNGGAPFEAPMLDKAGRTEEGITLSFRNAESLMCLRPDHDLCDFSVEDEAGPVKILALQARGGTVLLRTEPGRPIRGKLTVSYGCHPHGPEGGVIDQRTYLNIIAFDHAEVSE